MNQEHLKEVRELADRHCDGLLTAEETERLNALLQDNPEAQKIFLEVTSIHARLQWEFGESRVKGAETPDPGDRTRAQGASASISAIFPLNRKWIPASMAASVMGIGLILGLIAFSKTQAKPTIARLKNSVDARWRPGYAPRGIELSVGRLCLEEGLAEIDFECGATAVLKAPIDIELVEQNKAFLHAGQVLVRVPQDGKAIGFRVETPSSQLVDLGTEFGVEVDAVGSSLLQVYEGEVLASTKSGKDSQTTLRVLEGQAVRLDNKLSETDFWPERFVRVLPGPEDPTGRGKRPYNRSRFDAVFINPAADKIVIDGQLGDWNLSDRFRAACEPPYAENYYLEAAMMYDDENLYLSAHVGDPYPLRSQIAPTESAMRHGMGGAVSLRLSTDRAAGWPLTAEKPKDRPATPADVNDKLTFLVLWYYQPEAKACIHLRHGMDLHGVRVNPPGYQGAFLADVDGKGYTLEYAIPWNLLNAAEDPPQSGDELAAMWLAHWSNPDGRKWMGQLIEVMKPNEEGWNFERAATWGKAVYR